MKKSYTVPCASAFRDSVVALAEDRRVNVGDLARSILLAVPREIIDAAPDPGEPLGDDREAVILKSGPAVGRPWRRKPRLQVRMADDTSPEQIRKALGLALKLAQGQLGLDVQDPNLPPPVVAVVPPPPPPPPPSPPKSLLVVAEKALLEARTRIELLDEEVERLRAVVSVLAFQPLHDGVRNREEALHVLGFPPGVKPSASTVRARFRMLATIHHPDSPYGSHERMSQLNAAVDVLRHLP